MSTDLEANRRAIQERKAEIIRRREELARKQRKAAQKAERAAERKREQKEAEIRRRTDSRLWAQEDGFYGSEGWLRWWFDGALHNRSYSVDTEALADAVCAREVDGLPAFAFTDLIAALDSGDYGTGPMGTLELIRVTDEEGAGLPGDVRKVVIGHDPEHLARYRARYGRDPTWPTGSLGHYFAQDRRRAERDLADPPTWPGQWARDGEPGRWQDTLPLELLYKPNAMFKSGIMAIRRLPAEGEAQAEQDSD